MGWRESRQLCHGDVAVAIIVEGYSLDEKQVLRKHSSLLGFAIARLSEFECVNYTLSVT